jgi:hypothetical protein
MQLAERLSLGIFLLSSIVVSVRLLLLARRTGRLPEKLAGFALLCIGPLGYGSTSIARLPQIVDGPWSIVWLSAGLLSLTAGSGALYYFVFRVFRPDSAAARWLCYSCGVALVVTSAGDITFRLLGATLGAGLWWWASFTMRLLALVWASGESFRYYAMMRRRQVLGLADPLITQMILHWGLGSGCAAVASAIAFAVRALTGKQLVSFPEINVAVCGLSLIAAITQWLAFFPPAAYARAVRIRAERALASR